MQFYLGAINNLSQRLPLIGAKLTRADDVVKQFDAVPVDMCGHYSVFVLASCKFRTSTSATRKLMMNDGFAEAKYSDRHRQPA